MINVCDIEFAYEHSYALFVGVSFSLVPGNILYLRGENASGKTTLLKLIAGFETPQKGTIKMDPFCQIVYVPAELHLFLLPWYTVEQNIAFFASKGRAISFDKNNNLLNKVVTYFDRLPFTFYSIHMKKVYLLSSGQKAAIALLCAILSNPSLLLLDEIFANTSDSLAYELIDKTKSYIQNQKICIFTGHNRFIADHFATHNYSIEDKTFEINGKA